MHRPQPHAQHPSLPHRHHNAGRFANATPARTDLLDVLRGSAIALMFVYHFCYDLTYYGLAQFDFYHGPFWPYFRLVIVSSFLFIVGISLHLATRHGLNARRFGRRLAWLLSYAALVSLGSYLLFAERWIFFGILHFIAVASVAGLWFSRYRWLNLWLGLALILLGSQWTHPLFDHPLLQWLGMVTRLPATEDYVPLLPWFGVVLLGMFCGKQLFTQSPPPAMLHWQPQGPLARLLALAGRHSLHIYMLHQPLFLAMLYPVSLLIGRG
ncbi:MAG: heparan-alpha-glucosaminide N-acetyltransferase [Gammaproteobacteria bacterium]